MTDKEIVLSNVAKDDLGRQASATVMVVWLALMSLLLSYTAGSGALFFMLFMLILSIIMTKPFPRMGAVFVNLLLAGGMTIIIHWLTGFSLDLHSFEIKECRKAIEEVDMIHKASGTLLEFSCSSFGFSFLKGLSIINNTFGIPLFVWTLLEVAIQGVFTAWLYSHLIKKEEGIVRSRGW